MASPEIPQRLYNSPQRRFAVEAGSLRRRKERREERLVDEALASRAACTSAAPDGKINRIILPNCSSVPSLSPTALPFSFLVAPVPWYYDSKVGVTRKVARAEGTGSPERNGKYSSLTSYPRRTTTLPFGIRESFMRLRGPAKICHELLCPAPPCLPPLSLPP